LHPYFLSPTKKTAWHRRPFPIGAFWSVLLLVGTGLEAIAALKRR